MSKRSVTIGITAYDAQETIGAAIESALAQDIEIKEIIVVDDASNDGTVHIISEYVSRHPKVMLVRHMVNQGVAQARNTILDTATGEFIAFFDDDDVSAPERVRLQMEHILRYERDYAGSAPVVCHTAREQLYPYGQRRVEPAMGQGCAEGPNGLEVLRFTLMGERLRDGAFGSCATCSQMARLSTYMSVGGFDPSLRRCEDTDLALRVAKIGGHFTGLSKPLVTQRMTATSDKTLDSLCSYFMDVCRKHAESFDSPRQLAFCQEWVALKFLSLAGKRVRFFRQLFFLACHYPKWTCLRIIAAVPNSRANRTFGRFSRKASLQQS